MTGILPVAVPEPEALQPIPAASSPSAAQTASIGGTMCKKLGQTRRTSAGSFRCTAVGKQKTWRPLQTAAKTSTTTTTTTTTNTTTTTTTTTAAIPYSPPTDVSDNIEFCKIEESSQRRGYTWAGFPNLESLTRTTGRVKWALIPIDFEDLQGEKDFRTRVDEQMQLVSEWFETASEGKFRVDWVVADRWITVPGASSDYPLTKTTGVNNTPGGIKLFRAAMAAADAHFDFTDIQTVNFILPKQQNIANEGEQGFPWDHHVRDLVTQEGRISSFSIAGKFQNSGGNQLWSYWIHEFGHAIGLPHVGSNGPEVSPFNPLEIMGGQDGPSLELSGWLRFLARWMDDERVYCRDARKVNKVDLILVPLSNGYSGIKLAVFPLSATKALVIESRRVTKFSCLTPTPRNGVLVYLLDLTLGHGQDFLLPILPSGRESEEKMVCGKDSLTPFKPTTNPLLQKGDKVNFSGLTVEVLEHRNFDKVRISR